MLEHELIRVKSTLPDQDFPDRKFAEHSAYIETGVELNARDFVGPRFSDLQDSEGELWPFIADDNGVYHFEIATEIPFYLPECYGPDQFLEISNNRLFFCNRMVRAFFGDGYPDTDGLNYILTHRAGLDQIANRVGHLHPIPIKTFVSRKFYAEDSSAGSAVQSNLPDWLEQFIEEVNKVLEAFRRADPVNSKFMDFVRSENSFPHFWLACTNNGIECVQISPNLRSTTFLPANAVSEEGREIIEGVLDGEVETYNYQIMLSEAYNYAHYGRLELALVHLSIACEIAISLHLINFLKSRNVSNTKLDDHFDNITYSQMINIHLFSMYDMSEMDDFRNKIGQIDWARKKRNKIVHEGGTEEDLSRNAVEEALDAATDLINFMTTNEAEPETA